MLTLKLLREDPEFVIRKLAVKNFDAKEIVARINELDSNRRALQTELDACLAQQNRIASQIGALMKQGKKDEAEAVKKEVAALKEHSKSLEEKGVRTILSPDGAEPGVLIIRTHGIPDAMRALFEEREGCLCLGKAGCRLDASGGECCGVLVAFGISELGKASLEVVDACLLFSKCGFLHFELGECGVGSF